MACPSDLELSAYLDDELDAATANEVARHVAECAVCASFTSPFTKWTGARDRWTSTPLRRPDCPPDESLLAYVSTNEANPAVIENHLASCTACVSQLQILQHRLSMLPQMTTEVPADIRARVSQGIESVVSVERPTAAAPSLMERLSGWLRLPVLAPAAFAMGVLIYVASTQLPLISGNASNQGIRSVPQAAGAARRIGAAEAWVYAEPRANAPVITKLSRGSAIAVSLEDRGWYKIQMADGRSGWVDGTALE